MSDSSLSRTLGEQESLLLSRLSAGGYTLFTIEDARAVLKDSAADVRKLLHRLHRKRWIKRLERGTYLIVPITTGTPSVHPTRSPLPPPAASTRSPSMG